MASRTFNQAAAAALLAAWSGVALGGGAATEALLFLGRLNRPDALEPAGCHGSLGVDVGAGATTYALPDGPAANPVLHAQLGDNAAEPAASYAVPRVWLTKGLPLPVDVGVSAGSPMGGPGGGSLTQISGNLQWTVYEAFARPALALRGSYGRLFGVAGTELTSYAAEAVASYGFLRYFTVYGVLGAARHRGSLTLADPLTTQPGGGLAVAGESPETVSAVWTEPIRAAGLKVMLVPPSVSVTVEAELATGGSVKDVAAKLSYNL